MNKAEQLVDETLVKIKEREAKQRETIKKNKAKQEYYTKQHKANVKRLRKNARNKKELIKATEFLVNNGIAITDPWGFFDLRMSKVLAHTYTITDDPPEARNIECRRCGKCCELVFPSRDVPQGDGTKKDGWVFTETPCGFLEKNEDGTTSCKCYGEHIGKELDFFMMCLPRSMSTITYEGCPYNPIIEKNISYQLEMVKKYGKVKRHG